MLVGWGWVVLGTEAVEGAADGLGMDVWAGG
jgi:hypothetical protein